jgi:hypothetical protein
LDTSMYTGSFQLGSMSTLWNPGRVIGSPWFLKGLIQDCACVRVCMCVCNVAKVHTPVCHVCALCSFLGTEHTDVFSDFKWSLVPFSTIASV